MIIVSKINETIEYGSSTIMINYVESNDYSAPTDT